jgi:hypothetical protein
MNTDERFTDKEGKNLHIKPQYISYLTEIASEAGTDPALPFRLLQEKFPELSLEQARSVIKYWKETRNQMLNEGVATEGTVI